MELIISGRHFDVDADLREYAESKMGKLEHEYPKLTSARVVMITERNWQIAEVHLNGKHLSLNAKAQTDDMMVSVDTAVDRLERQLRRHLERVQDHRVRKPKPEAEDDDTGPDMDDTVSDWDVDIAVNES